MQEDNKMRNKILLIVILVLFTVKVKADLTDLINQNVIKADDSYKQIISAAEQVRKPSRLWIHLHSENKEKLGEQIYKEIHKANLQEVRVEIMPFQIVVFGPSESQLRYFKEEDNSEAQKLFEVLHALLPDLKLKDFSSDYLHSTWIERGQFELWIPPIAIDTVILAVVTDETAREIILDILAHEGGYADHPRDPIGASMYGITLRSLRRLYGSDLTKEDLRSLTKENAISYYYEHVFLHHGLNALPKVLWLPIFDATVSSGPIRTIKWLQSVCVDEKIEIDIDGILGESTIACANTLHRRLGDEFVRKVVEKRLDFLRGLSVWKTFGKEWERRISRLLP